MENGTNIQIALALALALFGLAGVAGCFSRWQAVASERAFAKSLFAMKPDRIALLFFLLVAHGFTLKARCQEFQNLNFEGAALVPIPNDSYGRVYFAQALPHWTGLVGASQSDAVLYDNTFLGSSGVSILDSGWSGGWPNAGPPLQGSFSVLLQAGADLSGQQQLDVSLAQTGLVPSSARSLRFLGEPLASVGSPWSPQLAVSLGGSDLSVVALQAGPGGATVYGADVSAFAGQTLPLAFTIFAPRPFGQGNFYLDSISFSPEPVPEPSTVAIFAVGGCLAWLCRKRKAR